MTWRLIRSSGADLVGATGVFLLNSAAIVVLLRLWHADMHVPFQYFGDNMFNLAIVRDVIDHGWFLSNPDLGFPFGQHLTDYGAPSGDNLTFVLIKVLALFTTSPGLIINLVYVLSFPVVAVVAFLVLRRLGISTLAAAACGTLYTLVPYHFLRTEGHLFLAFYYSVPLIGYLLLELLAGRPLFTRRASSGPRWLGWASRKSIATLAICAVVASGGIYYAVFALLLLGAVLLIALISGQPRATVITGAVLIGAILTVMLFNLAPSIVYHLQHGKNAYVAQRQPFESELYSLKFMDLVLPVLGHRLDFLNQFQGRYHVTTPVLTEPTAALGIVGTVGFLWLLLVALSTIAGRSLLSHAKAATEGRERHAAFVVVVAFLLGTFGGISAFIAYAVSPEVRGWGRISMVIAFMALFAVGLLLDRMRVRFERSLLSRLVVGGLLGAILLVGMLDQTNRSYVPNYSAQKAEFDSDATFAKAIVRAMPPNAAIMQLPYMPFPENPGFGSLLDYDLLRPYVHGGGLRWSYGTIKGRSDDWQEAFFGLAPEQVASGAVRGPVDNGRSPQENFAALAAAGFDGVYIDRLGYGDTVSPLETALRRIVGRPPLLSPNGRQAFYSLLPYAAQLRARYPAARLRALGTATTNPLEVKYETGFYPAEPAGKDTARWAQNAARLEIDSRASAARTGRFKATIQTGGPATVTFRLPGGSVVRKSITAGPGRISLDIPLNPGRNVVRITTDAPRVPGSGADSRVLFMRFLGPELTEPAAALPDLPRPPA